MTGIPHLTPVRDSWDLVPRLEGNTLTFHNTASAGSAAALERFGQGGYPARSQLWPHAAREVKLIISTRLAIG